MQRYFLDKQNQIQKDDLHHILKVMRMQTGDQVEVCDQLGNCHLVRLKIEGNSVTYDILSTLDQPTKLHHITLIQGLGKGDKNEFVIKYATQFGVDSILFVEMKRSVSKMDEDTFIKKQERYIKIAEESARLSHRNQVPTITFLPSLKHLKTRFDLGIVAYENDRNTTLIDKIEQLNPASNIALVIGPEGGIDTSEMALLKDNDFISVGLGTRILQTEVACLYGLSVIDAVLERKK